MVKFIQFGTGHTPNPIQNWGRRDLNPEPTDYESAALTD